MNLRPRRDSNPRSLESRPTTLNDQHRLHKAWQWTPPLVGVFYISTTTFEMEIFTKDITKDKQGLWKITFANFTKHIIIIDLNRLKCMNLGQLVVVLEINDCWYAQTYLHRMSHVIYLWVTVPILIWILMT